MFIIIGVIKSAARYAPCTRGAHSITSFCQFHHNGTITMLTQNVLFAHGWLSIFFSFLFFFLFSFSFSLIFFLFLPSLSFFLSFFKLGVSPYLFLSCGFFPPLSSVLFLLSYYNLFLLPHALSDFDQTWSEWPVGNSYKGYQQFDLRGHVGVTGVKKVIFTKMFQLTYIM